MSLKVTTVKKIDELELSKLIKETYGRPYQLQQVGPEGSTKYRQALSQNEIIQVTVPEIDTFDWDAQVASFETWKSRDATPPNPESEVDPTVAVFSWELEWERELAPPLQPILNDLHARGLLEAGSYVIHVWW